MNLADGLAKAGCQTLLVDLDPQCNATTGLGRQPTDSHPLVSGGRLQESLLRDRQPRVWSCCPAAGASATWSC